MRKKSTRIILVVVAFLLNTSLFAADFVVTSEADAGPGTLRQAVLDADNSPGLDNITFDISSFLGPIELLSPIDINSPVNISGYGPLAGDPGTIPTRSIVVGITAPGLDIFRINSGDVTISGLAFYGSSNGIVVEIAGGVGGPVKIWGNYFGADEFITFSTATAFTNNAIVIGAENTAFYTYANPRVIIGTDGDGNNDAIEGNLISNATLNGVLIGDCDNNVIAGNYIGTTQGGAASASWARGNGVGIRLNGQFGADGSANNRIGTNSDGTNDDLERNIIGGNKTNGIIIENGCSDNLIAGNGIGLNATLTNAASNRAQAASVFQGNGVLISDSRNNVISNNFISSNARNGVTIYSGNAAYPSSSNTLTGNKIGLNISGIARGNGGWGIHLINFGDGLVTDNIIGSNDDGTNDALEANTIRFNAKDGVGLQQTNTGLVTDNRISRNVYGGNNGPAADFDGAGLAINLLAGGVGSDGITVNDAGDGDDGANTLFNYPEITKFGVDALFVSITGTVNPGATMQFYLASADGAPANTNYKEGSTFLINLTDNGPLDDDPNPGSFSFLIGQQDLGATVAPGVEVNAIAFSAASGAANTSEFSAVTATVLPVQFLSFDAALKGDKVLVSWTTAQERNASHFEVEKSTDGINFKSIGRVAAAGNSNRKIDYSFTDNNVESGVSYYRLRQVDLDAKAVFTRVVPIRNEGRAGKQFFMWPNPVVDMMNITINQAKPEALTIRVVDMNGRTMITNKVSTARGLNQLRINASALPRGMYVVQVAGEETLITEKIIKN